MGGVVNRMGEHLAPSDRMISVTRRRLLDAVRAVERGEEPPAAQADTYAGVRGGYFVVKQGGGMLDAYRTVNTKRENAPA
jgi:hypothetical protein